VCGINNDGNIIIFDIIMLLETFDPSQKIEVMHTHIFGNLIPMYYTVSNHLPSTSGRCTTAGTSLFQERALTFRHFRPLVSKIRVTSILLLESDRDGGRDMISHEELNLLIYSRAIGVHIMGTITAEDT